MKNLDLGALGLVLIVAIIISAVVSYPMMLLWNYCLTPAIPGLVQVGWMQMWGIVLLIKGMFQSSVSLQLK